jgi:hypothetical protein
MDANCLTVIFTGEQVLLTAGLGAHPFYLKRYVDYTAKLATEAENQREGQVSPSLVVELRPQGIEGMVSVKNIGSTLHSMCRCNRSHRTSKAVAMSYLIAWPSSRRTESIDPQRKRSLQFPDTVFAATAFDEIVMVETLTVTCRMISNWLHTFRFERESGTKDFVLAEHL